MLKIIVIFLLGLLPNLIEKIKTDDYLYGARCEQVTQSLLMEGYQNDKFIVDYFYNLNNFTNNASNNCGYIAINLLLDYFDSFWDDDIIPEKYDYNSNGDFDKLGTTESPSSTFQKNMKYDYPFAYHMQLDDTNFMKYLIDIAIENKIIDNIYHTDSLKMNYKQLVDFMHYYLKSYTSSECVFNEIKYNIDNRFSLKEYDENMTNDEFFREQTKNLIKKGIPVILLVTEGIYGGHAVVAYDYSEENDIIYCHFGYDGKTHVDYRSRYPYIRSMYAISPQDLHSHKHCDNYIDLLGEKYCSCKLLNHNHDFGYVSFPKNHKAHCYCGFNHLGSHILNVYNVCIYCNRYVKDEDEYHAKD